MSTIKLMLNKSLMTLVILCITLLASTAMASIMNGDFSAGGMDWNPIGSPDVGVSFPGGGGNPGGYARFESSFYNTGGSSCFMQTFTCGDPDQGTECTIEFDYYLTPIDAAPGTARLIVIIDGISSVIANQATTGWNTVSYVVPCGIHIIEFCFIVDPDNNAWEAGIDNVTSVCTGGVPNEAMQWNGIKSIYR